MMLPTSTIASPPISVSRRCRPSLRRPMIGAEIAPDRSAIVSDHCALSSEMWNRVRLTGISGAPRLLMIPVTIVIPMRTGTS